MDVGKQTKKLSFNGRGKLQNVWHEVELTVAVAGSDVWRLSGCWEVMRWMDLRKNWVRRFEWSAEIICSKKPTYKLRFRTSGVRSL